MGIKRVRDSWRMAGKKNEARFWRQNLGPDLFSEVWPSAYERQSGEKTHTHKTHTKSNITRSFTSLSYFTVDKKANQNKTNRQSAASERNKMNCMHV